MSALPSIVPTEAPARVAATSAADVRDAVLTAREHDVPLAIRATGHAHLEPPAGAVLLDTSGMAAVLVDPDRRVARVGPGAVWGDVLAAAAPFGLAPLSGSSPTVGVTGYTVGGGLSWLSRRHGFAADSVLRADVVTADGRLVTATAEQRPDLFWALRGGGGNFGVVTSLEFRLHPVRLVCAGTSYHPIERAAETLARYREWIAAAPDALSTAILLTRLPDGRRVLGIRALHAAAEPGEARRLLRPLREAAGPVLQEGLRVERYADVAIGGTPPRHVELMRELPDAAIDALVAAGADTVEVRHWGGAMAAPGPDAGPVGHRDVTLSVIADGPLPALAGATGGSFLNFLADTSQTASAYTAADYARLRSVKRAYDPGHLFRAGHAIPPA